MFPKNGWYIACTPDELAAMPSGRQICGEKIVFYYGHENEVLVVEDFCPPWSPAFTRLYRKRKHGMWLLRTGYGGRWRDRQHARRRVRGFPCN